MLQYVLTVIAPNGSEHEFIFPENIALRRLTAKIAADLRLPYDTYQLIDPFTTTTIPVDATMKNLFPDGAGTLWLKAGQSDDNPALPEEYYFDLRVPPRSYADLWEAVGRIVWYTLLTLVIFIVVASVFYGIS